MLLFDAEVDIAGPDGSRTVVLADLYRDDGMDHLTLGPGELVTSVYLTKAPGAVQSGYEKSRIRGSIDFPLAGVAVRLALKGDRISDLSIALTGVNPLPRRVTGTERLIGRTLDTEILDSIRDLVRTQAKPMRTTTVKPWYRRRVIGALARKLTSGSQHRRWHSGYRSGDDRQKRRCDIVTGLPGDHEPERREFGVARQAGWLSRRKVCACPFLRMIFRLLRPRSG